MNFIIQFVVGLALSILGTLWEQANRVEQQKKTGTRGTSQVGGKIPRSFLIGTVADAGKLVYPRSTWGNDGEVPNAYLTSVLSFGCVPVTAIDELFVSSSAVTLNTATPSLQGYAVPQYLIDGKNHLWWAFERGAQTSASAFLMSKFGSNPDRPWTAAMVGRGVPYLALSMLWGDGVWASSTPSTVGQFRGIPLYDIRRDSTKGGSGAHRWAGEVPTPAEQATWEFSDNNMVIIYNLLRGVFYNGQRVWGGRSTAAQLPFSEWKPEMDKCDVLIALNGGGTERQFRGGRKIYVNEEPRNVINEFLVGCTGRISYASDGTVYPLVGVPAAADGAFTDFDVLATEPLGSFPFPRLDDVINGATATYREPSQAWDDKETAPYYRSDLEAEDDGRRQTQGLTLDTTFSGTQAQRVLKATVEEARRFGKHVVALRAPFSQYRPLQRLDWTSERFGYVSKGFLVTMRTRPIWGWVVLALQEIDPSDHNWTPSTDERPLSFAPVTVNRPAPQEVSGPSVAPVPGQLAYDVFWSAPSVAVDVQFVRVSHRRPGEPDTLYSVLIPKPSLLAGSARVPVGLDLSNTLIEVQLEYVPYSGRPTVASSWMPVTIADVKIGPNNLTGELNEQRAMATRTIEEMQADRSRAIAQMANSIGDRMVDLHTIRTEVAARFDTTEARYSNEVTVIAGSLGALVDRTEVLEAEVNDPVTGLDATAEALSSLRVQVTTDLEAQADMVQALEVKSSNATAGFLLAARVVAGPAGTEGAVQLGLRQEVDGTPIWAGLIIALKDGVGKIYLDANETIVTGILRDVSGNAYWNMNTGDIVSTGFWSFG